MLNSTHKEQVIVKDGHTHTHACTHRVKIVNVQLCVSSFLMYYIEGQCIKQVEQYKDLGIML